ncbi:hypothetical protein BpHYR1_029925 [Brachionus plicatilis]|uniref:Uncharacterized protein n=1 Tax=Brachionus plicatilis TaxID=10195 RepID=A0A3M7Q7C9_BRAPC|nr:hypothetical protein BpHYR1_029925 [Brachionus plicatilis]
MSKFSKKIVFFGIFTFYNNLRNFRSFRNSICSDLVNLCLTLGNIDSSILQILPTPPNFKFFV